MRRRTWIGSIVAIAAALALPASAAANSNVTISAAPTANMTTNTTGGIFYVPTGNDGNVNVGELTAALASGNAGVFTVGGGNQEGTLTVNAPITWASANLLVLFATDALTVPTGNPITATAGGLSGTATVLTASAPLTVAGATDLNASFSLANPLNDFQGPVSITQGDGTLVDQNALTLGTFAASTGDFNFQANGPITQTSPINQDALQLPVGTISFDAGAGNSTTLTQNNILKKAAFAGGSANVKTQNPLVLSSSTLTGDLTVDSGGTVTQSGGSTVGGTAAFQHSAPSDVSLVASGNNLGTVRFAGTNNADVDNGVNSINIGTTSMAGNLTATSDEDITATGAITANGAGKTATFQGQGMNSDVGVTFNGSDFTTVAGSGTNFSVSDANAVALGNLNANSLSVTAGGSVTQAAGNSVTVPALTNLVLTAGSLSLTNATNDLGTLALNASGNASVTDADDIVLGNVQVTGGDLTVGAGAGGAAEAKDITQTAGGNGVDVTGTSALNAPGPGDVTVDSAANDFGTFRSSTQDLSVRDANAITLGLTSATGTATVQSAGPMTQTGALDVDGAASFDAGTTSPITLTDSANDFDSVAVPAANGVSVVDANDLELAAIASAGDVRVTAQDRIEVSGDVSADEDARIVTDAQEPTAPDIGTGGITIPAGGSLTGTDSLSIYTARRTQNVIDPAATLNASAFTPGSEFVDSATEEWGAYFPGGTTALPFTIFYKEDGTPATDGTPTPTPNPTLAPETRMTGKTATRFKARGKKASVSFAFDSPAAGATFICKLDNGPEQPCSSPFRARVRPGRHTLTVWAVVGGVRDASPTVTPFRVVRVKPRPKP